MKIYPRSENGIFMLRYTDPRTNRTRRVSTGKRTRKEAEAWAQQFMSENKIASRNSYRKTLGESLWDTYRRVWRYQKSGDRTYHKISLIDRKIGSKLIDQINYEWLNDWVESEYMTGRKPPTVFRDINLISRTLREAHRLEWIDNMPPMPRAPKFNNEKYRWVSDDEEQIILDFFARNQHLRLHDVLLHLVPFLIETGMRLSEARNLPSGLITPTQAAVMDAKNGKNRTVPITSRAHEAWMKLSAIEEWDTDPRRRPRTFRLSQQFGYARDKMGIPDISLHTLRHTCATRLLASGFDLYRVATWLGHSDVSVTQRYAHVQESDLLQGAALLEQRRANLLHK